MAIERVALEFQWTSDGIVPVDAEEDDDGDEKRRMLIVASGE